jgi:chemotaxis protein CheX
MEPFATDTPTAELCRVRPGDLTEIARSLFDTMLGLPFEDECPTGCSDSGTQLEAHISVSGCWSAEILVRAPEELARQIACVMFKLSDGELTDADVRDALGEVANVIGGSVKGIVDCDCDLTLPRVDVAATGQKPCSLFRTFQCNGLPVCIAVIEQAVACNCSDE